MAEPLESKISIRSDAAGEKWVRAEAAAADMGLSEFIRASCLAGSHLLRGIPKLARLRLEDMRPADD